MRATRLDTLQVRIVLRDHYCANALVHGRVLSDEKSNLYGLILKPDVPGQVRKFVEI